MRKVPSVLFDVVTSTTTSQLCLYLHYYHRQFDWKEVVNDAEVIAVAEGRLDEVTEDNGTAEVATGNTTSQEHL